METRIPLPTDNIFKFYALFGLLLFIFTWGAMIYVVRSSNETVFSAVPELESLKQIEKPTHAEAVRVKLLERKLELSQSDKKFFQYSLGGILSVGVWLMIYGFRKWHRGIQVVLDKTAKVQLEIAELQLAKLRREFEDQQRAEAARSGIEPVETPNI